MNYLQITFHLILHRMFLLDFVKCQWNDLLKQKITRDLKPHQVSNFISDTIAKNLFVQEKMFCDYPSMVFTFGNNSLMIKEQQYSSFSKKSLMQNSLVLFYTDNPDELKSFIDFLIPLLSVHARPRCLLIFFGYTSEVNIKNFLKYAWGKHFLDISLVRLFDENSTIPKLYDFNPFYSRFTGKYLSDDTQIFPDKLKNVNGYPIQLPKIVDYYSSTLVVKNGKIIKNYEPSESQIDFVLSVMNFLVIKKLGKITSYNNMIEKWNANMFCFGNIGLNYETQFGVAANEPDEEILAFVPILPAQSMTTFSIVFWNMIIVVVVILISIYTSKSLKVSNDNLGEFNIVRIILGQMVVKTPEKTVSRIIYLILITPYVKLISFDFYNNLIEVKFESNEVPFESFEELDKSNFEVYTNDHYFESRISHDKHLKNMVNRTHVIDNLQLCWDKLVETSNIICLTHEISVYYIREINKKLEYPVIKADKPSIWNQGPSVYYKFEEASPFQDKFSKILRRIQETSLVWMESLIRGFDNTYYVDNGREMKNYNKIDSKQLV